MALRVAVVVAAAVALLAFPPPVLATDHLHPGASGTAVRGLATDAVPLPAGSSITPLASSTPLRIAFTVPFSNSSRLSLLLRSVANPRSAQYRGFLSYPEFEKDFGPSASTIRSVESSLSAVGATSVHLAPGGLTIDADLPASSVEHLLGVHLVRFEGPTGATGYTALGPPRLPPSLEGDVVGIDGLGSVAARARGGAGLYPDTPPTMLPARPVQFVRGNGTGGSAWYLGSDYAQAYGATELFPGSHSVSNATFPRGVAIATLLASGYDALDGATLPPWTPSVVDAYYNETFPASWSLPTVTGVLVDESVASAPPPGPLGSELDTSGFETENSLDLEMAGSLAPGSSLYNFYFSGALAEEPLTASFAPQYLADDLGAALSYGYGASHLAVVSCSFGLDDLNSSQWDAELLVAAASGVTVVASSGDQGNAPSLLTGRADDPWPLWPATAAFNLSGAISVGGVTVDLDGTSTGTFSSLPLRAPYDPTVSGFESVTAWWDTSGGVGTYAGTEGGTSSVYAEPPWQFHSAAQPAIVNTTEREGFSRLGRAGPDVAFPANSTVAYIGEEANGSPIFAVLGGTSVAAPVFAGVLADVTAVENATRGGVTGLGFLDPELYRIASYYAAHPGAGDPFLPVDSGSNELFSAGPGWDPLTGWGGVSAPLLLAADENRTVADYAYEGPTPSLPGPPARSNGLLTLLVVLVAAAAVVAATALALSFRTSRRAPALPPGYRAGLIVRPPPGVTPPTAFFATFSCPTCGLDRPAEPGRCPRCGAM